MKIVLNATLLLIISISGFSQNSQKDNLGIVFYDNCSNQIINPEFEVLYISELNYDLITVFQEFDNWILQYSTVLKTKNDTIRIPNILFAGGNELHSQRWAYFNCGELCDGEETGFYKNGNTRTSGTYEKGKPVEIKEYRENGTLRAQYFYDNLTLNYKRIDYFDENEDLEEYQVYVNKKRRSIIKTFDKNGNLLKKQIEKKHIIKNK